MARAAILFAAGALLAVLLNVSVGALLGFGLAGIKSHTHVALPSTVFALFAWMIVLYYFIGATAWVQQEVEQEGASALLLGESRAIRAQALPAVIHAVLALIAAYVLGGGADTGAVPGWVHLALALLALLLHARAFYRTTIFVGMALDLQARVEAGLEP